MKKNKLLFPVLGLVVVNTAAGVLISCSCNNSETIDRWPGKMIGKSTSWSAISEQSLKVESGRQYMVEFDWTECGALLGNDSETVSVVIADSEFDESYDFAGTTYKLEAFNTNTNQWDTIQGLEPKMTAGLNGLLATEETAGGDPWLPDYYKKGCKFTFSADKSSTKELFIQIGVKNM